MLLHRLFNLYSTWLIRPTTESIHTSYSFASTTQQFSEVYSTVSTLHDSSIGITPHDIESNTLDQSRVIGRLDFEKCICDLLPKYSRSQCATQATRLFDLFAVERNVSKTVDGPCCSLYVLNYDEFVCSIKELPKGMKQDESDLKSYLISEVKYNMPVVEHIVNYDELLTISTFWIVCLNTVFYEYISPKTQNRVLRRIIFITAEKTWSHS